MPYHTGAIAAYRLRIALCQGHCMGPVIDATAPPDATAGVGEDDPVSDIARSDVHDRQRSNNRSLLSSAGGFGLPLLLLTTPSTDFRTLRVGEPVPDAA